MTKKELEVKGCLIILTGLTACLILCALVAYLIWGFK